MQADQETACRDLLEITGDRELLLYCFITSRVGIDPKAVFPDPEESNAAQLERG